MKCTLCNSSRNQAWVTVYVQRGNGPRCSIYANTMPPFSQTSTNIERMPDDKYTVESVPAGVAGLIWDGDLVGRE